MMKTLDLADCPFTRVYEETVALLQADPVLAALGLTWFTADGSPLPAEMSGCMPFLRLEPQIGGLAWYDPSAHSGYLLINVRLGIQSRAAADRMNLWAAVANALYPRGDLGRQLQIQQRLRDAGAEDTGQYEFHMPAALPDPRAYADGYQFADGQMRISVVWTFNP